MSYHHHTGTYFQGAILCDGPNGTSLDFVTAREPPKAIGGPDQSERELWRRVSQEDGSEG